MENEEIKKINSMLFLSIFGVATFVLAVFGVTYAYFRIQVTGNETASSVIIETADLGTVTFNDGNSIVARNIYPVEEADRFTKTFTIASTGNTVVLDYKINLIVTENSFLNKYANEFTYTLNGTSTNGGTTTTGIRAQVPAVGTTVIGTGTLSAGGDTHTYTFTIGLNEVYSNQNSNQGKSFSGYLEVVPGKYYTAGGSAY